MPRRSRTDERGPAKRRRLCATSPSPSSSESIFSEQPPNVRKAKGKAVLQHGTATVVMPAVAGIAHKVFRQSLCVAGETLEWANVGTSQNSDEVCVHETDPVHIEWVEESRSAPHHYRAVTIDGVQYSVGDAVVVEKGPDDNHTREQNAASEPAQSLNLLANSKWFAIISYMYETEETVHTHFGRKTFLKKFFHAQWLQHGSQTLLQEMAHPNGLFYLNECDDLPLECIFEHCHLQVLAPHEGEPPEDDSSHQFHTGLTWDSHISTFFRMDNRDVDAALAHCKPWKQCLPCGLSAVYKKEGAWQQLTGGGVSRHGIKYHCQDFVYLRPPGLQDELYYIVQIMKFNSNNGKIQQATVLQYGRYDQVVGSLGMNGRPVATDNRRLFKTDSTIEVDISLIDGKAFVAFCKSSWDIAAWTEHDDHFYVDCHAKIPDPKSLDALHKLKYDAVQPCSQCYIERVLALKDQEGFLHRWGPLRGLELFAGAGGLSTGLDQSGFVKTCWAVEFSPSAALTYEANHPNTTVYNQCSNLLLQHVLDTHEGKKPKSLYNLQEGSLQKLLPPMPKQGEVDFIYGGPPCQGFSGMNHHKKVDDVRNTLVCNMLSYVEFYRPAYFLLENVLGLIHFQLMGSQAGQAISGGIEMGVVKFIMRTLLSLGYQVHWKVLQAGQYGSPQDRRRVIFWGARWNVSLPEFPVPMHWFPKNSQAYKLPTGDILYPATRGAVGQDSSRSDYHQCAPLPAVTVEDAIGDLPCFDWINPHQEIPMTDEDLAEAGERCADGIQRFSAIRPYSTSSSFPGFSKPTVYSHPPLTRYQKWMRSNMSRTVAYQYTHRFSTDVVERVTTVPIRQNADHVDLPARLRLNKLFINGIPRASQRGMYGRVDGKGVFHTAMTKIAPNGKGGRVIHPTQKRLITVRECARAQGFPDHYRFLSANKLLSQVIGDQHRQIGNAVPVPLSLALGMGLGHTLIKDWSVQETLEAKDRAQSPEILLDGDRDLSPEL